MHNPYHVTMVLNAIGYGNVWCFVQWRAMRFNESHTMLCHVMMCCAVLCCAVQNVLRYSTLCHGASIVRELFALMNGTKK